MTIKLPGVVQESPPGAGRVVRNFSTAAQVLVAETLTYITGSKLAVPESSLKVGSRIRFALNVTKTAAGIAASTYAIVFGTAGDATDTARVSFTKPAGTAAIDEGKIVIEAIVRSVGAAGVVVGEFTLVHNLASTGHAAIPVVTVNTVSAGFDNDGQELFVGLVATTGAADDITIQMVEAELAGV